MTPTEKKIEPKFEVDADGIVSLETPDGQRITVPGTIDKALSVLSKLKTRQDTVVAPVFNFQGLVLSSWMAINEAIKETFGDVVARGEGFWGTSPPSKVSIKIRPGKEVQVFTGILAPAPWKGGNFTMMPNKKDHMSLQVIFNIKQKYEPAARALMELAKEKVRRGSFYNGGAWDLKLDYLHAINMGMGYDPITCAPTYIEGIDDPGILVLPRDIEDEVHMYIWDVIRNPDDFRYNNIPVKGGIVKFGDTGTGKTLTVMHTIKRAIDHGWSVFRLLSPQWFAEAYRIAAFYAKSVLVVEDAEKVLGGPRTDELNQILDSLDGAGTKNKEVIVIITSNHPEQISEYVLRSGRLGTKIEYRRLDGEAAVRFINEKHGQYLVPQIDEDKVGDACFDLSASDVDEIVKFAKMFAIRQFGREITGKITTEMLVRATELLRRNKGLIRKPQIHQDTLNTAVVRWAEGIKHGLDIPPEVFWIVAQYFQQPDVKKKHEKEAKARVPQEGKQLAETSDR